MVVFFKKINEAQDLDMYNCLITLSKVHSGMAVCQHEKMIPVRRIDRDEKR